MAPEVVQTSAMDCGPAALKCLLEGFAIPVSLGRLREACQTDVDGTSIDTLEEVASQLGLDAAQVMLPVDHVLLPEAGALPALVVVRLPAGDTHFVVVWRRHAGWVQVMDPATGRRWSGVRDLMRSLYVHTAAVPAEAWRAWAETDESRAAFQRRLADAGLTAGAARELVDRALAKSGWEEIAALDASLRMVSAIVESGGLDTGPESERLLMRLHRETCDSESEGRTAAVPENYWSVRAAPPDEEDEGGDEKLLIRGAVLIRVRGRRSVEVEPESAAAKGLLSAELTAALGEGGGSPGRELLRRLAADGLLVPAMLGTSLLVAAAGVVFEAILLRGLFEMGRDLGLAGQRLGAMAALLVIPAALLCLELAIARGSLRIGRRIEVRLRAAFMRKIPRLGDRYFQSRLTSDMAERGHSLHLLRTLPHLAGELLGAVFQLLLTTAGIVWLAPDSALLALIVATVAVAVPLLASPVLGERDLRLRTHAGGLGRFYMDALLGLVAIRAHAAEKAVRREHDGLLGEWARASMGLQRSVLLVEGLQTALGFGLVAWLLLAYLARAGEPSSALLLVYWALNLPVLGQKIALITRQYPGHRNVTLRVLEPLGAPEATEAPEASKAPLPNARAGVRLTFEGVCVRAAGHRILEAVDLDVRAGEHLAVVGSSGAGKSSLVGILLGWHRLAQGQVLVDGTPLNEVLGRLRAETAWVDPTVQLWNRSLLDNLCYGVAGGADLPVGRIIEQSDLRSVLERLPEGLQSRLGESGGLVSGGEAQRVRFGRALLRSEARLVILDEPFRGLERERRRKLLTRARALWQHATLLCITHDVGETASFGRVLVVEAGQVVEDDAPEALLARPGSRYRSLMEKDEGVVRRLWSDPLWRRIWIDRGRLTTEPGP